MSEFGIPTKLIRLCKMTLTNTRSAVRIGKNISEPFSTKRGFRQGDSLSCDLFNILLEKVIRDAGVNKSGTLYTKSHMLLAYADDIDIMGRSKKDVADVFNRIEKESAKIGLAVNEDKTKLMISTSKENEKDETNMKVGNYNFEIVKDFIYLGTAINQENNVGAEIRRRIVMANRCYYGLSKHFKNKATTRHTKITLYKTLILPVLLYGSEAWVLTKADETALGVFERKILRKVYGPIRINGEWRRRMNHELYELYADIDVVKRIKLQRISWLGHVVRMDETAPARISFESHPDKPFKRGKPKNQWKEQVVNDIPKDKLAPIYGVRNWRRSAQDRNAWNSMLRSARGTAVL